MTAIQEIERISLDIGNRKIAVTDGQRLCSFPSYSKKRTVKQDLNFSNPSYAERKSFQICVGAVSYLVGSVAENLNATETFNGDKWKKAKEFFFASLRALEIAPNVHIKELFATVPDDQAEDQLEAIRGLQGAHSFSINGEEYAVVVDEVNIVGEGKFAWVRAINEDFYEYPGFMNGVLDLGGGTAIARLFGPEGDINRELELIIEGGTARLATAIAQHIGEGENVGIVMNAIADGSYRTPVSDFSNLFEDFKSDWVAEIRGRMKNAWREVSSKYAQILVIGGSAPLWVEAAEEPDSRYVIPEDPQFYALEGMQKYA